MANRIIRWTIFGNRSRELLTSVPILMALIKPVSAEGLRGIYVAATGSPGGKGTAESPFVLSAGGEYELNRLIRRATDAGQDVDLVFGAGVYRDVRLQIIKQGIDTGSVYNLEPGVAADGQQTVIDGKPFHYYSYAHCNREAMNCRVDAQDYAIGPNSSAAVTLRAAQPHQAIFDGSGFQSPDHEINNNGLTIAGAYFGVAQETVKSEPIKNVNVIGLVFRNYWNGILIQHARGITIDDCIVENVGLHHLKDHDDVEVGVSGFSANGDSELVLIKNTTIRNSWDIQGSAPKSEGWPTLMHSVYDGDSRDIIFINNVITGSSGPMLKFGYYATEKGNEITYEYGKASWNRRGFFIKNHFTLAPIVDNGHTVAPYKGMQAFIHDNSETKVGKTVTPPAKGMVFINNVFRNELPHSDGMVVTFMRQELPAPDVRVDFPDFFFFGNRIEGVQPDQLIVHRERGTPVTAASTRHDNLENVAQLLASLNHQTGDVDVDQTVSQILAGALRSPSPSQDQMVANVIHTGKMPRVP